MFCSYRTYMRQEMNRIQSKDHNRILQAPIEIIN